MSDVQVKCTCTYLQESSSGCQTQVDIEIYFEHYAQYPDTDPRAWRILAAPVSLCIGCHKVSWIPVGAPVEFTSFELKSTKPVKVNLNEWPPQVSEGKWTAVIENTGVTDTNGFSYQFWFKRKNRSGKALSSRVFMHDPTIAVTPDPIEIPPGYPLATKGREESLEGGLGS